MNADQVLADFLDAQTGKGTRYLAIDEARQLLQYCAQIEWAFQSMEVSEVVGKLEYPRIDLSLLGLTDFENTAATLSELHSVANRALNDAESENSKFIFKVWVDSARDMLAKNRAARSGQ